VTENVVSEFCNAYTREFDYYQSTAALCSQRCEALLATQGIRAIVSHRAKKPAKLLLKVQQRNGKKKYRNADEIREDIPDLAGVRIALYFPADRERVKNIISENFDVVVAKSFPERRKKRAKSKRFDGYHADHYRVQLTENSLEDGNKAYSAARIEIQVGSVLMHAWAEVEHDLVYKPESGNPSEEEHAILDELNGLVITGEVALERLQKAVERRLSNAQASQFDNHYELAAYLYKTVRNSLGDRGEPPIGRVDILWELLKRAGMNSPDHLTAIFPSFTEGSESLPVSDQIADTVLASRPDLYPVYVSLQSNFAAPAAYTHPSLQPNAKADAIGRFLSSWIVLERTFSIMTGTTPAITSRGFNDILRAAESIQLSKGAMDTIMRVRRIRNQLVHGIEVPAGPFLDEATSAVNGVLNEIERHPEEYVRMALEQARALFGHGSKQQSVAISHFA
jgi:ppGpp synthetase/RelA/SpoT-type nucleotidyltranferase